jgi:formylglycine-generating enzyme required for sulfatase activity
VFDHTYYWWSPRINPNGRGLFWEEAVFVLRSLRGQGYNYIQSAIAVFVRSAQSQPHRSVGSGLRVARSVERATLLGVSPASGSPAGGTLLTLTGTNMGGVKFVSVGGVAATEVTVVDPTRVTARTPPGTGGAYEVSLDGASGSASIPGAFTYASASVPSWAELLEPLPDPVVVIRESQRDAITATGLAWRVRDSATGIEMVLIPPGSFIMGLPGSSDPFLLPHSVTLTNPFYMSRYELTQEQWRGVMGYIPVACSEYDVDPEQCPSERELPASHITWIMAQQFCAKSGLRLPTEAEWEFACRAGTASLFHGFYAFPDGFGTVPPGVTERSLGGIAWAPGPAPGPIFWQQVGRKAANGFGLHDMSGNAREWVADWYGPYPSEPQTDPAGPDSGTHRVRRGGSVQLGGEQSSGHRKRTLPALPDDLDGWTGLRPVRDP